MFARKREAPRPPAPASEEDDSREASPEQASADEARDRGTSSTAPLVQVHRKKKRAGKRVQGPDHMQKKVDSYRQAHAHRVQRAGFVRDQIMDTLPRLAHIPKYWGTDHYNDQADEQASRALVQLLRKGKSFNETEGREYDVVIPSSGYLAVDDIAFHLGLPAEYIILVARCSYDREGNVGRFQCDRDHTHVRAVGKHSGS